MTLKYVILYFYFFCLQGHIFTPKTRGFLSEGYYFVLIRLKSKDVIIPNCETLSKAF